MRSFLADSNSRYIQSIDLPAGQYTFSAIVKSPNMLYSFAIEEIGGWRTFDLNLHTTEFKKVSIQFLTAKVTKIDLVSNNASASNVIEIVSPMLNGGTIASPAKRHELDLTESITSQEIFTQYSVDGSSNWHDTYVAGDRYMRTKKGEGNWSAPMLFVGEDGAVGADGKYTEIEFAKNTSTTTAPTSGWQDAPPTASEGEYVWMRQGEVIPPATTPSAWSPAVRLTGIQGAQGLQGLQGVKGDQGIAGTNGTNGQTSYFHIKYSPVSNPTNAQMTETPDVYIGTYVDYNPTDSTLASSYTWSRFQGVKGDQGIAGNNGADGQTYYLHIAYADNASGGGFSQDPTGKSYIGTYTDTIATDASAGDAKWKWVKFIGTDGVSVTSVVIQYAKNTSATVAPTSGWQDTRPIWESGTYLWQRTFTTYSNATTSAGTASLDNTWQAEGKIVELENTLGAFSAPTIDPESNTVLSGNLLVGNESGTQAGISGLGTSGDSVRFFAGSAFANRETAPWRVHNSGMQRGNHQSGNKPLAFEWGVNADGTPVLDFYHVSGYKTMTLNPNRGLIAVAYFPETWEGIYMLPIGQSSSTLDVSSAQSFMISKISSEYFYEEEGTPEQVEIKSYYLNNNIATTYFDYDNGSHPDNTQYESYKGYKTTYGSRTENIADGWYALYFDILGSKRNPPESYIDINYQLYYMSGGKVANTQTITIRLN